MRLSCLRRPCSRLHGLAPAIVLTLMLGACGSDAPSPQGDARQAEGEVLEGSISDDMIELDQLRSRGDAARETGETGDAPASEEVGEGADTVQSDPAEDTGTAEEAAEAEAGADEG